MNPIKKAKELTDNAKKLNEKAESLKVKQKALNDQMDETLKKNKER